jgi:hypothetical protein
VHAVAEGQVALGVAADVEVVRVRVASGVAVATGPEADALVTAMAAKVHAWNRDLRHGPRPRLTVHPLYAPVERTAGTHVLDKRHVRLVLTWNDGESKEPDREAAEQSLSSHEPRP